MKKSIISAAPTSIRLLTIFVLLAFGSLCNAQTITSLKVLSPICPYGSGTVQVSFSGVSYPFTLEWNPGRNINNIAAGSTVITGSPQTITIFGSTRGSWNWNCNGTSADFYSDNFQRYFGAFNLGITYDTFEIYTPIKATCSGGATIAINNISGGTGPYTLFLLEKKTGKTIASGSSPLNIPFSTIFPLGKNLGLRVQDATGCYSSIDSIQIDCQGLDVQTSSTTASCTNGTATVVSVNGGVAPYTYKWSNAATTTSINGLSRGGYYCIATDSKNCSGIGYAQVGQNPVISVNTTTTPATCNNADGQAMAFATGGTSPYTYLWPNGSTTQSASNLVADGKFHQVIVTDSKGCLGNSYFRISSISPIVVSYSTTSSSCTTPTGTISLSVSGGKTPYSYIWDGLSFKTNTATGLAPGQYSFTVTDANGCERKGTVIVPPVSQISASIITTDAICPSNKGSIKIIATSSALPLTYLWNNGDTTASQTNLNAGSYTCTITDANKCKITKTDYVSISSGIEIGFNSKQASCIFSADGSISVFANGGTSPYTYRWSNGATTATIAGLSRGYYWVDVTDANGCRYSGFVNLGYDASNNSCYCTIDGIVYNDLNGNCTQDAGEDGISDILIKEAALGYITTNANGYYSFKAPKGSYTLIEKMDNGASLSNCQSNNVAVSVTSVGSGCKQTVNFSNQLTPTHDIHICKVDYNSPRPGNTHVQKLILKNKGNVTEPNIQASFSNDGQLNWQNSYGASMVKAGTDFYKLSPSPTLKKGAVSQFYLDYYTPTNIPLGTSVYFRDSASYASPISTYWLTNDETPWNNICDLYTKVVNSYDPNYKTVYPQGTGNEGKIELSTKDFRYVVHFENNGTAPALKVVVTDTLDSDLDIESFRTFASSHAVDTRIQNGVVTFTFDNINLDYTPKDVFNINAQGYVIYTIKAKSNVIIGTKLESKADIYFDYNAPIPTNKATNLCSNNTGVKNTPSFDKHILAFPNPTTGNLQLQFPTSFLGSKQIEIANIQGMTVKNVSVENEILILDVSMLQAGLYIATIKSENGAMGHVKFLKQ